MTRSDSHRFTRRWRNRTQVYDDRARFRVQIHRRNQFAARNTSIRYATPTGEGYSLQRHRKAILRARQIAARLKNWPAKRLAEFIW